MGIGERIKAARARLNLDREALADRIRIGEGEDEKTGVNVKTVWRWEKGRAKPEADTIAPLASALRVSVAWLLTGEEEPALPATGTDGAGE